MFNRLTVTIDTQNVSLLPLNTPKIPWKILFETNVGSATYMNCFTSAFIRSIQCSGIICLHFAF
jgi:hypothetical protein